MYLNVQSVININDIKILYRIINILKNFFKETENFDLRIEQLVLACTLLKYNFL